MVWSQTIMRWRLFIKLVRSFSCSFFTKGLNYRLLVQEKTEETLLRQTGGEPSAHYLTIFSKVSRLFSPGAYLNCQWDGNSSGAAGVGLEKGTGWRSQVCTFKRRPSHFSPTLAMSLLSSKCIFITLPSCISNLNLHKKNYINQYDHQTCFFHYGYGNHGVEGFIVR